MSGTWLSCFCWCQEGPGLHTGVPAAALQKAIGKRPQSSSWRAGTWWSPGRAWGAGVDRMGSVLGCGGTWQEMSPVPWGAPKACP